jgi:hypothetical protein
MKGRNSSATFQTPDTQIEAVGNDGSQAGRSTLIFDYGSDDLFFLSLSAS